MEKDFILGKKELNKIKNVRNREGEIIPFNINKIADAIYKAFVMTNEGEKKEAKDVATRVFHKLIQIKVKSNEKKFIPMVEMIQDLVEAELMDLGYHLTAKSYILYRSKRAELRREVGTIPTESKKIFDE